MAGGDVPLITPVPVKLSRLESIFPPGVRHAKIGRKMRRLMTYIIALQFLDHDS